MQMLTEDRFLQILKDVAYEQLEPDMLDGLVKERWDYKLFQSKQMDSLGTVQFVTAFEDKLEKEMGCRVEFPMDSVSYEDSVFQFYSATLRLFPQVRTH